MSNQPSFFASQFSGAARHKAAIVGLAGIGVAIGLMHLPLSLELGVTLSNQNGRVRTFAMLLYPIAMALTGLGAVMAMWRPRWAGPGVLRVAGLALLGVLVATLRLNFLVPSGLGLFAAWIAHLVGIGAWYITLGAGQTLLLSRIRTDAPGTVGLAWGVHLLGLLIGYALSEGAVGLAGANAVLLTLAVTLLVSPRLAVLLVLPGLLLCKQFDVDGMLESARHVETGIEKGDPNWGWKEQRSAGVRQSGSERVHLGWSRLGQVQVFETARRAVCFYNLKHMFEYHRLQDDVGATDADDGLPSSGEAGDRIRHAIYRSFVEDDRLLIIGVGAGRSLHQLTGQPTVEVVERDPEAARFFSELRPDLNEHAFDGHTLTVADGRFVLDRSSEGYDAVILESSRYGPIHPRLPLAHAAYLHTRESLEAAFGLLRPGGVVMVEVKRAGESLGARRFTTHLYNTLSALSPEVAVIQSGKRASTVLLACRDAGCIAPLRTRLSEETEAGVRYGWPAEWDRDVPVLTDARPFSSFEFGAPAHRQGTILLGLIMAVAAIGSGLLLHARDRRSAWRAVPWFFALGVGHTGLQLHAFHVWRTYFGDELRTVMWLIVAWLAYGALGSILAGRLGLKSRRRAVGWTVGLLVVHLGAQAFLPYGESASVRWIYALLAGLPGGVLLGLWMPLGLSRASSRGLGSWLAADAVGTLASTAAVYCLMVPLGSTAYLLPVLAAYLFVAARWRG